MAAYYKQNYQLIITPKGDDKSTCNIIKEQISRHCDYVSDITIIHECICIFCGRVWEETWIDGSQPLCCNDAMKKWDGENTV
jgi:hypothetical protein